MPPNVPAPPGVSVLTVLEGGHHRADDRDWTTTPSPRLVRDRDRRDVDLGTLRLRGGADDDEVGTPPWMEPSAYTYTLTSSEGERALIGTFEVTVRDGKVVETTGLDESGRLAMAQELAEVPTIAELLRQSETARREGADKADVEYTTNGRPTRISIDWDKNAIDDEEAYAISAYEPLD